MKKQQKNNVDMFFLKNSKNKIKAFTLVELIIVITILAILATIWFMSFQSYTLDARDTNRVTSLKSIKDWLSIYQIKNNYYPIPDTPITISLSWVNISYQWLAWKTVLSAIKANDIKDPSDNIYYTYITNKDKNNFQLLSMLENNPNLLSLSKDSLDYSWIRKQVYAQDYTNRYPKTLWNSLWILLDNTNNSPVQINIDLFLAQSWTMYKIVFNVLVGIRTH